MADSFNLGVNFSDYAPNNEASKFCGSSENLRRFWTSTDAGGGPVRYTNHGFMERLERSLSTEVVSMPATAVAKIASYVSWRGKLSLVEGVPEWAEHLRDTEAWPELLFEDMPSQNVAQIRAEFLHCLTLYGRYMLDLHMVFKQEVDVGFTQEIFDKLQRYATNLSVLRLSGTYLCVDSVVEAFVGVLQRCARLKAVHLHWPHTYLHSQNNVVLALYNSKLSHLLHTLDLSDASFEGDVAHLTILRHFRGLRKLRVKRDRLSGSELVALAHASLRCVSLFQDEESPSLDKEDTMNGSGSLLYDDCHWAEVVECKSNFRVNVLVKNIYILRSVFPAKAPIRSLVFVDISSTLTKGLLDHVVRSYSRTLEIFVYSWTCDIDLLAGSNLRLDDRRVPASLPHFVRDCPRLRTLVYGYEIASIYVLLAANTRTLDRFVISVDALRFDETGAAEERRGEQLAEEEADEGEGLLPAWLLDSCQNLETLELTVSNLFGYKWKAADAMCMAYAVEHFSIL